MPISIKDIADFIQMVVTGFEAPLYYGFTCMMGFAVACGVKRLFLE
jgi:hypothetical protein